MDIKVSFYFFSYLAIESNRIVLANTIEDPSMLTQSNQRTARDPSSIGTTLKHNIAEKLPAINTQVKYNICYDIELVLLLMLLDCFDI